MSDGLAYKREVSGRTGNLQEKSLQNDVFVPYLIFFHFVTPGLCLPQTGGKAVGGGGCHWGRGGIWGFRRCSVCAVLLQGTGQSTWLRQH